MAGRPPKTAEDVASTRARMLDAAGRVFAEKGYAAARMSEIAAEAGYTAAALYRYFGGKHELYEGLIDRSHHEVDCAAAALPPVRGTVEEEVDVLFEAIWSVIERNVDFFLLLVSMQANAAAVPPAAVLRRSLTARLAVSETVAARLAEAAGADRVGSFSPLDAANLLHDLCYGAFVRWATDRLVPGDAGAFRERLALTKRLYLHGIAGAEEVRSGRQPRVRRSGA